MNIEVDIRNVVIRTKRLVLRPFNEDDLNDFFEYASVPGVGEMAGWSYHKNIEESKNILDMFISGNHTFAIEYENKVIGSLGIEKYDEKVYEEFKDKKGAELGFVLSKDYWGKGIMPEAVESVITYLIRQLDLDFITCSHFTHNTQSCRVQEKCGFKFYKDGKYETRMGDVFPAKYNILIVK